MMKTSAFASSAGAGSEACRQAKTPLAFVDNRPKAKEQEKLAGLVNGGPRAIRQKERMDQISGSSADAVRQKAGEAQPRAGALAAIPQSTQAREPDKTAASDADEKLTPEAIEAKRKEADFRIDEAKKSCRDSATLEMTLQQIKMDLGLKAIEIEGAGTPAAKVRYQVNPWFHNPLSGTQIAHEMTGLHSTPITKVTWLSENLTIGSQTARVGKHMVASPLGPDHEAGSDSSNDSAQNAMMGELLNAGKTGVGNDKKYIKGHLLNDNTGGPGESFNLFPITADANAKHLAYVEKFVKSQLQAHRVVNYEVRVNHGTPVDLSGSGSGPYAIDASFDFYWHLLDVSGKKHGSIHKGSITSIANTYGTAPFDVTAEYAGLYDKLNLGKSTPHAKYQSGQWQEPSISQVGKTSGSVGSALDSSLTGPIGFFGASSSSSSATVHDFTGIPVKSDSSGISFISIRNGHFPPSMATGDSIQVGSSSAIKTEKVSSISPMSGGWTRIYF